MLNSLKACFFKFIFVVFFFQPKYKAKIEVIGDDDSDSDSDNEDDENKLFVKPASSSMQNPKPLIQEIGDSDTDAGIETARSQIGEVSMENIIPEVSDIPRTTLASETSDELMAAIGKVLAKSPSSRREKIDFSEEEKKFASMTKEEKIQDLAANVGSTLHRKSDNMDIWKPEDELD